ncbi:hypothetical protein THMIRHAM_02050 [Thiomicrorhabdus immobilis]|uniref:Cbb3-type cytochrome oxidase assembly protein CcoS n=1 Tax=Thiomicrorhabdus immobilis TaxID=2791037 RepID=A0ABM7MAQ6_9GAMM|nr:cbb3-type cytochrome oxidase assembly protein CcoS [Thiomicrorhabdus immobilis]BCN92420.1 hypothetical protein THMIRHAM_02050 [Thiomicrorhabdus immobilis]
MDVIYGLIPMMLFFGFLVVVVFIWMAKNGHFDDMDGQANRIFMDDDFPEDIQSDTPKNTDKKNQEQAGEAKKQSTKPEPEAK